MLPYQGLIAFILGFAALVVSWKQPIPSTWWIILALMTTEFLFANTVRKSLGMYGMRDKVTKTWGVLTSLVQFGIIILAIYVLVIK